MSRRKTDIQPGHIFPGKHWKIIREIDNKNKHRYFLCECLLCNKEYEIALNNLRNENSCFCCASCARSEFLEKKADELIGQKFGRLTVISRHSQNKFGGWKYLCRCDCGTEKVIFGSRLKNGNTISCGCYKKERTIERSSGENSHFWKGGITPQNESARIKLKQYINPIIRERDNYTCQKCGDNRGGNLEVHHIFDFSTYPKLKFEETNLITLCKICHMNFHSIYPAKLTNTLADLEIWMEKDYLYKNELLEIVKLCQIS